MKLALAMLYRRLSLHPLVTTMLAFATDGFGYARLAEMGIFPLRKTHHLNNESRVPSSSFLNGCGRPKGSHKYVGVPNAPSSFVSVS